MVKIEAKKKAVRKPAVELTTAQIKKITDQLVVLRETLRRHGATVLNPTPEGTALRKEIALLNKQLNADARSRAAG